MAENVQVEILGHRSSVLGALENVTGGVSICLLAAITGAARVASSFETWLFVALAGKPLFDLSWRWSLGEVARQRINAQAVAAALVVVLTLITVVQRRQTLVYSRPVVAFATLALVSAAYSPTGQSLNELIRLCSGISLFFTAGVVLNDQQRFDRFAGWFLAAVTVPVVFSFGQALGLLPFEYWDWIDGSNLGRASGTYQHPLGLIYFLVYAVPLALYLRDRNRLHSGRRYLLYAFLAASLVALLLTMHRTALVAIVMQVALWFFMTRRWTKRELIAAGSVIVIITIASSSWLLVLYAPVKDILQGRIPLFSDEFLRGRGMQWYVFLDSYIRGGPISWVIGRGGSAAQGYVPGFGLWDSDEAHNDFIRILHAYGIVGLGLYLSILWRMVARAGELRKSMDSFSRALASIAMNIVPSVVVLSITTEPMRYPTAAWYLFALASTVELRTRVRPAGLTDLQCGVAAPI